MIYAEIDVLPTFFLLLDEARSQAATSGIDDCAALLSFDRRVEAEVLSTRQSESPKLLLVSELLGAVLHKCLQFR